MFIEHDIALLHHSYQYFISDFSENDNKYQLGTMKPLPRTIQLMSSIFSFSLLERYAL